MYWVGKGDVTQNMNEGISLRKEQAMLTYIKSYLDRTFVLFCFIEYKQKEMMPGA